MQFVFQFTKIVFYSDVFPKGCAVCHPGGTPGYETGSVPYFLEITEMVPEFGIVTVTTFVFVFTEAGLISCHLPVMLL